MVVASHSPYSRALLLLGTVGRARSCSVRCGSATIWLPIQGEYCDGRIDSSVLLHRKRGQPHNVLARCRFTRMSNFSNCSWPIAMKSSREYKALLNAQRKPIQYLQDSSPSVSSL